MTVELRSLCGTIPRSLNSKGKYSGIPLSEYILIHMINVWHPMPDDSEINVL